MPQHPRQAATAATKFRADATELLSPWSSSTRTISVTCFVVSFTARAPAGAAASAAAVSPPRQHRDDD